MLTPTPTANETLPFRTADFATLAEGLDYAARGATGVNFFSARGEIVTALPYAELRLRALELAARLPSAGLARGDRVGIIAETTPEFLIAFFACQYGGLVPVPLPLCINFGGRDAYVERLRGMLQSARARAAIGPAELAGQLQQAAIGTLASFVGTHEELAALPAARPFEALGAGEPCYIQYSSGSTSFPRGVLVTQEAITANARAIAEHGLALRPGDRCTSWLPLYHDMGLVGCCLTPALTQISVDYIATTSFARRPMVWLKVLSEQKGTISFSPTFGFELCARRAANGLAESFDLSAWRVAGIGGEMIRPKALDEFARTFAASGFDARAYLPSYGLAEATLAVSFSRLETGVKVDCIDLGEDFERRRLARPVRPDQAHGRRTRAFVVCGKPMPGYRIEVRDDLGRPLPERNVGRVCIQGPSLMTGYFRNPEASRAVLLADGWLDSGDMGYMVDGELVITGRSKDLIILNGRNIWPQDIEWAVEKVEGVRAGDVAAFAVTGEDDQEQLVTVVQCRLGDRAAQEKLRREVHATVQRLAGADSEVLLVPPRSLTFTTSGKLSRAAAKASFLEGALRDLDELPTVLEPLRREARPLAVAS
ncbi:fatty acyl-AMP ligase [Geminicoccaceae bacterium 1502E]|nr:fatty acyl-AMP ligase [Geminicoccaceae bacterium 1502E]